MQEFTKEELENETWKDIPEYEGMYQVSDLGRVKSLERYMNNNGGKMLLKERILKLVINGGGYCQINLSKNGKNKGIKIHQLVAIAFLNHVPCGHLIEVNHKDENKLNNRLENLELLTKKEHDKKTFKNKSSQYTGVYFDKQSQKWKAEITIKSYKKKLGSFLTEVEAHEARQKAEEMAKNGDFSFMKFREKSSKYKGVSFDKLKNKWTAKITINGKSKHLGYFLTELEAHEAVQKSLNELK